MKSIVNSMFNSSVANAVKSHYAVFSQTLHILDKVFFSSFLGIMIMAPLTGIMKYFGN